MKTYSYCCVILAIFILSLTSCNKKIAPSSEKGNIKSSYNTASFNYVFVEAIKQKLLDNGGDALKYFEQCIHLNPKSDAAYYEMAQIVTANGDLNNGKKYLLKAISINPQNIWYLTMLSGIYYQEKNLDSAIFIYEKAVKYFPEKENLLLNLGNLYSEDKKYEMANKIFDSFDKKYGLNETSTLSSIRNLIDETRYDEAITKTLMLLKTKPDDIQYNGILAEIYKDKGEDQKAMNLYDTLLERNSDNPQIQVSFCDFLISVKNYEDMFSLLNKIILNNKVEREIKISLIGKIIEIPDIYQNWGEKLSISLMILEANYENDNIIPLLRPELMIKENKLVEASLRLEEIIKNNPENYYAWEKLLFVYLQLKDYDKLFVKGEECATKFNTSFTAKMLYANAALEKGKYSIALDELKKAEILAAGNKEYVIQVLTMRADVYYRMKDYENSFETFKAAMKADSEDLTVMNNYAYYLAEQNTDLKEAEELSKKVIEKDKGNTTFLDTYGWVLYKRGKIKEAAKVMESVINSGEKPDAVWYEHYGYILKKEKNCDEAIKNWTISFKLDSTKTELLKEIEDCKK